MTYDPAENARKSYDVAIDAMREKLASFRCERIHDAVLYQGDCREILPLLPKVDAVVTDPPYGVNLGERANNQRFDRKSYSLFADTEEFVRDTAVPATCLALSLAKRAAITTGVRNMHLYPRPKHIGAIYYPAATGCNSWGFSCWQPIFYYGADAYAGEGSRADSFQSTEAAERSDHPCPKPIGQMLWIVNRATRDGETILDPFMGSGTTGVACAKLGRKFIGIELEERYFSIACKRIEAVYKEPRLPLDEPKRRPETPLLPGM